MTEATLKPGWRKWRFDQIATNVNERIDNPSESDLEYYVGLEHIDPDSLKLRRWGVPSDVEATKLIFRKGDIILGRRRVYQRKVAVAEFDGICSAHALVLRAKPEVVIPEFLPFFMQSDLFMERAKSISVGSLSPTINWRTLAKEEFWIPSLQEQKRLFVLISAVEDFVNEIQNAMAESLNLISSIGFDFFKDCNAKRVKVSKLSEFITKGESPGWQGFEYLDQGIPFITSENVLKNEIDSTSIKFIPEEFHQKLARSQIKPRDVLINIVGASIGRAAVVPKDFDSANTNQAVAVVRLDEEKLISEYFVSWYLLPLTQQFIASKQVNTARANISLTDIRNFELPVPDISIQRTYLEKVENISRTKRLLAKRLQDALTLKKRILNS